MGTRERFIGIIILSGSYPKNMRIRNLTLLVWSWVILSLTITTSIALEVTAVPDPSRNPASGGIILIRHGEGEQNVENRFNTNPDHPAYTVKHLTAKGRDQARMTADKLIELGVSSENICKVLVSPLPRTQETANILMGKLRIANFRKHTVDGLIESGMGDWEGRTHEEFPEDDVWFPENPRSYGGETLEEVTTRTRQVLNDLLNDPECDLGRQYVLLVSHGVPIYVMLDLLTGKPEKINPADVRIIHNPGLN